MNELTPILQRFVDYDDTVLDLGCGLGFPTIGLKCREIVGIDIHQPYLDKIKRHFKVIKADIRHLESLESHSFDVVLCLDVIEHLKKNEGLRLLGEMERIVRKRIIIYTPIGFKEQNDDAWGLGGEKWQKHRSGWLPRDFPDYAHMFKDKLTRNMFLVKEIEWKREL